MLILSKELDENCDSVAVLVSNEEKSMEDVIEAIDKVGRINKNIVWLHPFWLEIKLLVVDGYSLRSTDRIIQSGTML